MTDEATDGSDGATVEIGSEIASLAGSERALRIALLEHEPVDPTDPSRLPDWTVGHVLTHLARNADSMRSMLDRAPQYPHGRDGRNADIEAGADRSWDELVDDVVATSELLEQRMAQHDDWSGTVQTITADRPTTMVPIMRQREVEVHRVDLGLGYEFADMPAEYVRRDLRMLEMLWKARAPMGMTPLPTAVLAVPPAERLSWMMGRSDIDGVAPAGLF
ncbi:MAG: maleylpyruvate isomerase family mycothiol-dependent enzyme [Ilumatobacter sp.]|nr:maleylpyruvate isomerase family mycothiol-dependent enzyme [Ilumatobacter sp.]